jgi:hypothetical protein
MSSTILQLTFLGVILLMAVFEIGRRIGMNTIRKQQIEEFELRHTTSEGT